MTVILLRRRKLGNTSCREIKKLSNRIDCVVRNDQPMPNDVSLVIRWGTTSNVDCRNVLNTSEAIHRVSDKAGFRKILMEHYLNGKGDLLCPYTLFPENVEESDYPFPQIVRPRFHSQGKHVYLAHTEAERGRAARLCGDGWYTSQFVNKVSEWRITFVQGRVCWVARKTPGNPQDIAWNVARGGRFDNVRWDDWPLKAVRISREAFMLSGLDFGAVDVMLDAEGKAYVLEINSAPSQTSPYRQECMAKCFDWLIENGKDNLPVTEAKGGWRKFIHPALSNEAIMVG